MQFTITKDHGNGRLVGRTFTDHIMPDNRPYVPFMLIDDDDNVMVEGTITNNPGMDDFDRLAEWGLKQLGATVLRLNMRGETGWETY
jgi:hypothetical protein